MNTSQLGNIGEVNTLRILVEHNIPVYMPYGDGNEVDLIAIINNKCVKIQVKTTEKVHDNTLMTWRLGKQAGFHGSKVQYDEQSIDYFALYCAENDTLCFVPNTKGMSMSYSIRTNNYEGTRINTMHFVSDFTVDKMIMELSK